MNQPKRSTPRISVLLGGEGLRPESLGLWDSIPGIARSSEQAISLVYAKADSQDAAIQYERRIKSNLDALTHLGLKAELLEASIANPAELAGTIYLSGANPFTIVESLRGTDLWHAICSPDKLVVVSGAASVAVGKLAFAPVAPYPAAVQDLDFQVTEGLGLAPGIMVLPYFGWLSDQVIEKVIGLAPDLWLLGIDDQAALILHQDRWEVAGLGIVSIFKNGEPTLRFDPGMAIPSAISNAVSGEVD